MAYTFHPFPLVRAINSLIITVILIAMLIFFRQYIEQVLLPLAAIIIAMCILSILSMFALANTFSITLEDTSIVYRYGVMRRIEYVLPYSKITETRSYQGLMDQMFGLGGLIIDTAGYSDIPLAIREARMTDIRKAIEAINSANRK